MIDDEMHYLYKFFTDRLHYLTRIIARCQQEGKYEEEEGTLFLTFFLRST